MINTQYIMLNMTPVGVVPTLHCSQYDVGRPLGVVVYNGSESVDLDTYTCTIEATRTDGTPITAAVTTNDNIGAFATTATMTNVSDIYKAQLVLADGNGKRVASLPFMIRVVEAAMDENSESIEEDQSLYQQYTAAVQALIAEIREDIADLNSQTHDTVADMKADTNLKAGMYARTGGYYAVNDGGIMLYRIRSTTPGTHYETLSNGLYAEAVPDRYVTPMMYGAHGDGVTNDASAIQAALDDLSNGGMLVIDRPYCIKSDITISHSSAPNNLLYVKGIGENPFLILDGGMFKGATSGNSGGIYFDAIHFRGKTTQNAFDADKLIRMFFSGCYFDTFNRIVSASTIVQTYYFNMCYARSVNYWLYCAAEAYDIRFTNCVIEASANFYYALRSRPLVVVSCLIEGITNTPFVLDNTSQALIEGCYFEQFGSPLVKINTTGYFGVTFRDNYIMQESNEAVISIHSTIRKNTQSLIVCGNNNILSSLYTPVMIGRQHPGEARVMSGLTYYNNPHFAYDYEYLLGEDIDLTDTTVIDNQLTTLNTNIWQAFARVTTRRFKYTKTGDRTYIGSITVLANASASGIYSDLTANKTYYFKNSGGTITTVEL